MSSFRDFLSSLDSIPVNVTWMLQSIAEKRGHQELYTRQSPQKLRKLREYAMIESAVASNRIEGVNVDAQRVGTVVFGDGIMRDRDEEEVRGYRKALGQWTRVAALASSHALQTWVRGWALCEP